MITDPNGYTYIKQDWSTGSYRNAPLLNVDLEHPMPILDVAGLKKNPIAQSDIYHLTETATMIANAQTFHDVSDIVWGTEKNFRSQINNHNTICRLAYWAKNGWKDPPLGVANVLYAIDPNADLDSKEFDMWDTDSQQKREQAYREYFGTHGVSRLSDPDQIKRIPFGDDIRKLYKDLSVSRFVYELSDGCSYLEAMRDLGHFETVVSPLLGPHFFTSRSSAILHHHELLEEGWSEWTETFGDFDISKFYARVAWQDHVKIGYETWTMPNAKISINYTSNPVTYVKLYQYATNPRIIIEYHTFAGDSVGARKSKMGFLSVGLSPNANRDGFSFVMNPESLSLRALDVYTYNVRDFDYMGSGSGHFWMVPDKILLDTGPMSLPTALPSDWHYP